MGYELWSLYVCQSFASDLAALPDQIFIFVDREIIPYCGLWHSTCSSTCPLSWLEALDLRVLSLCRARDRVGRANLLAIWSIKGSKSNKLPSFLGSILDLFMAKITPQIASSRCKQSSQSSCDKTSSNCEVYSKYYKHDMKSHRIGKRANWNWCPSKFGVFFLTSDPKASKVTLTNTTQTTSGGKHEQSDSSPFWLPFACKSH